MDPERDDPFAGTRMTLGEHLEELRKRLIRGLVAVGLAFAVAYAVRNPLMEVATWPFHRAMGMLEARYLEEADQALAEDPTLERTEFFVTSDPADRRLRRGPSEDLVMIRVGEGFLVTLKICLYAALIFGAPVLLWQMWQFVAAGLYEKEKRAVLAYFPISIVAFAFGIVFGFLVVIPYGIYFLTRFSEVGTPTITADSYLSFLSSLCLAFGVTFQLPLVMTFLGRAGIVEPAAMMRYRGHFIVGAFVVAAMLTPPDPFTQFMMAGPLVVLYEIGVWSARAAAQRHRPAMAEEPA